MVKVGFLTSFQKVWFFKKNAIKKVAFRMAGKIML